MKKLIMLLMVLTTTIVSAEGNWTIEEDRIYTNGTTVHSHKFGYFKDEEWCDHDLIFIEWSTYEKGLEAFEGVDAKIAISLNGKEASAIILSTLVDTAEFVNISTLAIFKTIILSKELSKDIRGSDSVELTFVGPDDLVAKLDIKSDTFNTAGLVAARFRLIESDELCSSSKIN
jgi:hypothetical protein